MVCKMSRAMGGVAGTRLPSTSLRAAACSTCTHEGVCPVLEAATCLPCTAYEHEAHCAGNARKACLNNTACISSMQPFSRAHAVLPRMFLSDHRQGSAANA